MALFAAGLPISALGAVAKDLWTAVAFISIATACHQAWPANMFTVASDAFPSRAVGWVVGFGGMCGGIGGMLMLLVAGGKPSLLPSPPAPRLCPHLPVISASISRSPVDFRPHSGYTPHVVQPA